MLLFRSIRLLLIAGCALAAFSTAEAEDHPEWILLQMAERVRLLGAVLLSRSPLLGRAEFMSRLAERVRFELTSAVRRCRFSSLITRTPAYRTRTQTHLFLSSLAHRPIYVFRDLALSAT
jgi:hypothetical protein